jgi:hypothetical protein
LHREYPKVASIIVQNGLEKQFQKPVVEGLLENNQSTIFPERRQAMGDAIQWESELNKSLSRAKTEKKPVLMDFFNPG